MHAGFMDFKPYQLLFHSDEWFQGDGGTTLYGLYRYVRPQRVWFFSPVGHKLGIDVSHFAAILVIDRVLSMPLPSSTKLHACHAC